MLKKTLFILFFLPAFFLSSQNLYDIKNVKDVKVTFQAKDWDKKLDSLKKLGNSFRLIGKVVIDGVTYDSCGIRYKGNSSYNSVRGLATPKLPFNIKANEVRKKQRFSGGYEALKLSNVFRDPSFIREALSYEIAGKYMHASQANFVRLYVNDKLIGFYNSVEPVEEIFLQNHFGTDKGVLVKCDPDWHEVANKKCPPNDKASLSYLGEDPTCYLQYYEMKSEDKVIKLVDFVKILNKEPQKLESTLNVDQTLWMHALNNTLVNLDSYLGKLSHNYYVYRDTFGIWQPIIWDLNLSFGGFRLDGIEQLPLSNEKLQNLSPFAHYQDAAYPLLSQLMKNDLYRKIYLAHVKTILNENFTNQNYYKRAKEIQNIIEPFVKNDENKLYSYDAFKQNIEVTTDAGKTKIIGIAELMNKRTEFLNAHPVMQKTAPKLENVKHSIADDKINISTKVTDGQRVIVYYRDKQNAPFKSADLKNDGNSLFSIALLKNQVLQYYLVAVNENAATLSPERASHEFYEVK